MIHRLKIAQFARNIFRVTDPKSLQQVRRFLSYLVPVLNFQFRRFYLFEILLAIHSSAVFALKVERKYALFRVFVYKI